MKRNGFKIIGISAKTTNEGNQSKEDLGKLWEKFSSQGILEKIPNRRSEEIISVYTDYKSDYKGEYLVILGAKVSDINDIPKGMTGREFETENFETFTAKGKMPDAVSEQWAKIWKKDPELNRKYTYDYEVYGQKSQNGENSEVEIYVAVND